MGGMARMSGIPFRPKDKVPAKHGSEDESVLHENQPEPVVYDKDGIVYPKAKKAKATTKTTSKAKVTKAKTAKSKVTKPGLRVHVEPATEQNKPLPVVPGSAPNTVVVPAVGPDTNVNVPTYTPVESKVSRFTP